MLKNLSLYLQPRSPHQWQQWGKKLDTILERWDRAIAHWTSPGTLSSATLVKFTNSMFGTLVALSHVWPYHPLVFKEMLVGSKVPRDWGEESTPSATHSTSPPEWASPRWAATLPLLGGGQHHMTVPTKHTWDRMHGDPWAVGHKCELNWTQPNQAVVSIALFDWRHVHWQAYHRSEDVTQFLILKQTDQMGEGVHKDLVTDKQSQCGKGILTLKIHVQNNFSKVNTHTPKDRFVNMIITSTCTEY